MRKKSKIKWRNLILFLVAAIGLIALLQMFVRPNMEGWTIDQVRTYYNGNDIRIRRDFVWSEEYPYGIVINQQDCKREEECDIALIVSKGRNVSALSEDEIRDYLNQLVEEGILGPSEVIFHQSLFDDHVMAGYAIAYYPNPWKGTIEVTFSRGPQIFVEHLTFFGAGNISMSNDNLELATLLEPFQPIIAEADFSFASDMDNLAAFEPGLAASEKDLYEEAIEEEEKDEEQAFENEFPRVIEEAGFNLIARAGRGMFGFGLERFIEANEAWQLLNVQTSGSNSSAIQQHEIPILALAADKRAALLSYTMNLEDEAPSDRPYLANKFSHEFAARQIRMAHAMADVDLVIVSMDWEGHDEELVQEIAQWLADQGAHLVIGNQKEIGAVAILEGINGNETLVAYSLGQFVGEPEALGLLLEVQMRRVTVRGQSTLYFDQIRLMPTVNVFHKDEEIFEVLPLVEYPMEAMSFETFLENWGVLEPGVEIVGNLGD